jgi:8-oxo-dGTP pyrophosphatase MutT (NUDIX family)
VAARESLTPQAFRVALAALPSHGNVPVDGLTPAAVLIGLVRANGMGWQVIFTHRTTQVEQHKGQVSFPGGTAEASDATAVDTALREAQEEIGLPRACTDVLGCMAPCSTSTGFLITPVVAAIRTPFTVHAAEAEVERVFTVPLPWLADPAHHERRLFQRLNGREEWVYFFQPYEGEVIWGVTAHILVDLLSLVQ